MKIERKEVSDQLLYDIMYFSPIEVGDERYSNQLYFQTDIYNRQWPTSMADKMSAQIDQLRHVELGIHQFDDSFKMQHRDTVLFHCKMALAYLDAREARHSMKLCEHCIPGTKSTESDVMQDRKTDLDFLRITTLSVLACAARRVKFYARAVEALAEAKDICLAEGAQHPVHPLMTALTLLNLSAVLGDIDHDKHALRWGLQALSLMYGLFSQQVLPERVQAYYLALACHNAALLTVKLDRWSDAVELVNEGIEFTKLFDEGFDGRPSEDSLRKKLIAIGAKAKHVPEGFLQEAVNALNGWGEEGEKWNLSFWDFSVNEITEEIGVLEKTTTLKHLIIEHVEEVPKYPALVDDTNLARFILAIVCCLSLEQFTVSGIDFDPRKVWRRIKKRSFLETSWYASTLNFATIIESSDVPEIAMFKQMLQRLNYFSKKLVIFLVVLGNECEGVDLSENGIDGRSISALVHALRWPERPKFTRTVSTVILRSNALDADAAGELAKAWDAPVTCDSPDPELGQEDERSPTRKPRYTVMADSRVSSLDVSHNTDIGDRGFDMLTSGIMQYMLFKVLKADSIGLGTPGCLAVQKLASTQLEFLCLSHNEIRSEGAETVSRAAMECAHLHTLEMDNCMIDGSAAGTLAQLMRTHTALRNISLNNNSLGSEGTVEFCTGAGESTSLHSVHLAFNNIVSEAASEAIGEMMRRCDTLREVNLSGNHIDKHGAPHIGSAIEHSKVLKMFLEDMGFTDTSIDDFLDHGAAETQDLQVMILSRNPIGDEGLGIIAECLSIGLTELSLSQCSLTKKSQSTLLNLVSLSPNLKKLDLSGNNLGPTGCVDMVQWMTQSASDNFSLRSLELGKCGLGDEGFLQLVPILGALSYLGVRANGITSSGLEQVMRTQKMIQLATLDLAENEIEERGLHALTERFQQEHKRSLWNPKQLTSQIDRVILTDNRISSGLALSTDAFLKINNPLLKVDW